MHTQTAQTGKPAMHDYLLMITHARAATPAAAGEHHAAVAAYRKQLAASGALVDAGSLKPASDAIRVGHGGRRQGPFADALGSYALIRAADLDAATAIARDYPLAADDEIDVRPVMKGTISADKLDQPGKIFAIPVLGAANDEAAWKRSMDEIDALSPTMAGKVNALCGIRLEPPTTGKRVRFVGGAKRVVDGPFYEAKEVIGGVMFLRGSDVDAVTEWATGTAFAQLGSLELREVWRA